MTYEEFNEFCGSLTATSCVFHREECHVWKVGGKVFAVASWRALNRPAFTFKTSKSDYNILKDKAGYRPDPYMAPRGLKWIQQYDCSEEKDEALKDYLKTAHYLVSQNLSKKKQQALGLI